MEWIQLKDEKQLDEIIEYSNIKPVLIFKHSTRCSISSTAIGRLERTWDANEMKDIKAYYLDLISFRSISDKVSQMFNVRHESPQSLIIRNGKCVFNASHLNISYPEIKSVVLEKVA